MSALFTPLRLRDVTFRNRVFVSPMCQYSSPGGLATEWHHVHLGSRAIGGAGLVILEASAVVAEGRISPWDLGIWSSAQAELLRPIVTFIEAQGAVAGIQIGHAGRKASVGRPWEGGGYITPSDGGWEVVGPSALSFGGRYGVPRALSRPELAAVVQSFVDAAVRAREVGFRVLELHAAHGYLLHQFLSPLANQRTDAYGGSFENRVRLTLDVVRAVRKVWPESLPLFVRVSATDWAPGGWDLPQTIELARRMRDAGVDLVDCSSGGLVATQQITLAPGYQVPFAEAVKREAGVATGAVGLITEPQQAEEIVASGKADAVLIARAMLRDPYWARHAALALGAECSWPAQYARA